MAANDDTACLAEGKRIYRRQGFEVVIRDARKIDRTDKLTSLNAEARGGGIEPRAEFSYFILIVGNQFSMKFSLMLSFA